MLSPDTFFDVFCSKTEIELLLHINRLCAVNPGYMPNFNCSVHWAVTTQKSEQHSTDLGQYPDFSLHIQHILLSANIFFSETPPHCQNLIVCKFWWPNFYLSFPMTVTSQLIKRIFLSSLLSLKTLKKVWCISSNLSEECQFSERMILGIGLNPNSLPRELLGVSTMNITSGTKILSFPPPLCSS